MTRMFNTHTHTDNIDDVLAHGWFTTSETDFSYALIDEQTGQPVDFVVAEQVIFGLQWYTFRGHTVCACLSEIYVNRWCYLRYVCWRICIDHLHLRLQRSVSEIRRYV